MSLGSFILSIEYSFEFFRKQDIESLKVAHDALRIKNYSLLAQKTSASQEELISPCLKCIEHVITISSPESSNASSNIISSSSKQILSKNPREISGWIYEQYQC